MLGLSRPARRVQPADRGGLPNRISRLVIGSLWRFLCATSIPGTARSESDVVAHERRVKAAYLYKFAEYVEWPSEAFSNDATPLTIAVIGDDQLASELTSIVTGRTLDGRAFQIRRLRANDPTSDVHVLFVARGSSDALARGIVNSEQPVLVVTEVEGAIVNGATINFVVRDARVRFEVSIDDAERRGVKLSSRLLSVAQNTRHRT